MARLRNRIVKADYWGDGDLLRWPRDKRKTYQGLWSVAEDSGCLEDDPFGWKLLLWPSPIDSDITVKLLEVWRDELVADGKLIAYEAGGRRLFFIEPFHRHEHPRNPQSNDLPLPPWVAFIQHDKVPHRGHYEVDAGVLAAYIQDPASTEQALYIARTPSLQRPLPCPAQPSPALERDGAGEGDVCARAKPVDNSNGQPRAPTTSLLDFTTRELPSSHSTEADYARTLARHEGRLPRFHIERIVCELAEWKPKKTPERLHLTLNKWLAREQPPPTPDNGGPPLDPDLVRPDMVETYVRMVTDEGARLEDLRHHCVSEREYEAVVAAVSAGDGVQW